jgi:sulfur carrier protein
VSTIRITVNGTEHTVAQALTLAQLLDHLKITADEPAVPVASAVNGQYVAKRARAGLVLNDQDAVTTFEPITGG